MMYPCHTEVEWYTWNVLWFIFLPFGASGSTSACLSPCAGRQSWWRGRAQSSPWRLPSKVPSTTVSPHSSTSPVPWCRGVTKAHTHAYWEKKTRGGLLVLLFFSNYLNHLCGLQEKIRRTDLSCFGFFTKGGQGELRMSTLNKERCFEDNLICGFFSMDFCLLVFPINAVVTVLWRRLWKRILHPLCSPVKREEKPQSLWLQSALGVRVCGCMHSIKSCVPQPAVCATRLTAGVPSKFLWSVCCSANRRVWHQNLLLDVDG